MKRVFIGRPLSSRARASAIWLILLSSLAAAPAPTSSPSFQVGHVDTKQLPELSGLAPSRTHPGCFWAHNDSGNLPALFLIRPDGTTVRRIAVDGAPNVDWEDIAADTGNNNRPTRTQVHVYRFDEPDPANPGPVRPTAHWTLRYPDKPFDCEALFIHGEHGYLIPKLRNFSPPTLYRFPLADTDRPVSLEAVGPLTAVRAPVTAATLSSDARLLAVLTVLGPHVFTIDGDPARAVNRPTADGHAAFLSPRMESASFTPDGLLAGTEEGNLYLFSWEILGLPAPKSVISREPKPTPAR